MYTLSAFGMWCIQRDAEDSFNRCMCRDVRALSTGLAEVTEQPVRERFARLNQIVEILTSETLSDMMELWNDAAITWRINASEVRQVLSWRSDFDRAEVSSLQL
jgi:hypothetical protein